jgi:hypothetical protein
LNVFIRSDNDDKVLSKLAEILTAVKQLETHMAQDLTELQTKVQANSDVIDSAVLLLTGIKAALDAAIAANDPAALKALSDSLGADTQQLADAIAANTPAEPV